MKVGTRVRIRTGCCDFREVVFNSAMRKFEGREAVIVRADEGSRGTPTWVWVDEWLEPLINDERKDRIDLVLEGLDE